MEKFGIKFTADEECSNTLQDKDPVTQSALKINFYKKELAKLLRLMSQRRIRMNILISDESNWFMVIEARQQVRNILQQYFRKHQTGNIITILPITQTSNRWENHDEV